MTNNDDANWYTVEELAHIMRLDYKTALKVVKKHIHYAKIDNQYMIHEDEFLHFMYGEIIYPVGHENYIALYGG